MIPPIKIEQIPFKRKSPIKTAYKEGKVSLEKGFLGGVLGVGLWHGA